MKMHLSSLELEMLSGLWVGDPEGALGRMPGVACGHEDERCSA